MIVNALSVLKVRIFYSMSWERNLICSFKPPLCFINNISSGNGDYLMDNIPYGVSFCQTVHLEYLITTQRENMEKFIVHTRKESKLFHQIITDVLCTDGYCSFWKKKKIKQQSKRKQNSKANTFSNVSTQRQDSNPAHLPWTICES